MVLLMIPTATVRFISLTLNLPKREYSLNGYTHIGFIGLMTISAVSPFFKDFGNSSIGLRVTRSIFAWISWNLQGIWAVWQSMIGVYPFFIYPGWFSMITWAMKDSTKLGGSLFGSPQTYPLLKSLCLTLLMLKPTLSPAIALDLCSLWISIDLTYLFMLLWVKITSIPHLSIPVYILPTGIVPIPPILYISSRGSLSGLSVALFGGSTLSNASIRVGPRYQGVLVDFYIKLSPTHPEIGMTGVDSGLYPTFFKNAKVSSLIWSYLTEAYFT